MPRSKGHFFFTQLGINTCLSLGEWELSCLTMANEGKAGHFGTAGSLNGAFNSLSYYSHHETASFSRSFSPNASSSIGKRFFFHKGDDTVFSPPPFFICVLTQMRDAMQLWVHLREQRKWSPKHEHKLEQAERHWHSITLAWYYAVGNNSLVVMPLGAFHKEGRNFAEVSAKEISLIPISPFKHRLCGWR